MAKWQKYYDPALYYVVYYNSTGDDAGAGTKADPYESLNKCVDVLNTYAGALMRVAHGANHVVINQSISVSRNSAKPIIFSGEADLIWDGSGANYLTFGGVYNQKLDSFSGIKFKNYAQKSIVATSYSIGGDIMNFYDCNIDGGKISDSSGGGDTATSYRIFTKCTLKNVVFEKTNYQYIYCNYYNCNITNVTLPSAFHTLYFINNNLTGINFNINLTPAEFDYNSIMGNIKISGTSRDLVWIKANTTTNQHSISSDPLWTDSYNNDYTLQSNSPCLYAGKDRAHIGPYGEGITYSPAQIWGNRNIAGSVNVDMINSQIILNDSGDPTGILDQNTVDFGRKVKIKAIHISKVEEYDSNGTPTKAIDREVGNFPAYNAQRTFFAGDTCTKSATLKRCTKTGIVGTPVTLLPTPTLTTVGTAVTLSSSYTMAAGDVICVDYVYKTIVSGLGTSYVIDTAFAADIIEAAIFTHRDYVAADWETVDAPELNIGDFGMAISGDNSDLSSATLQKFPTSGDLFIDANGRGNADDDFDSATARQPIFRYNKSNFKFKDTINF